MRDGNSVWTRRRKELEELRGLVTQLEDEKADLLRIRTARLTEENERLSRGPDPWSALTAEEEARYVGNRSHFRAVALDDEQTSRSDSHR